MNENKKDFEIKIDDARYWKDCIGAINNLIDEGLFNITKEGISLKAMDNSGIGMVSFFMPNKEFSRYSIDKSSSIGINLDNLSKIMNSYRSNEELTMKDDGNKLSIEFSGRNSKRRYKLPIIDIKKDSKEPNVQFDSFVEVKCDLLKKILKDAGMFSSYITLKTDKGTFKVDTKGDAGELEEEYLDTAELIKKLEVNIPSSSSFNLEFLGKMIDSCPSNANIQLSLKSGEPLKIDYEIGDAKVSYYLAPYMEDKSD